MRRTTKILPALALALAAGCGEGPRSTPAPLDRFTFPTGLALAPLAGGGRALVVVSSNFELRFATEDGGSVLAVDPDASEGDALAVLGAVRIASFGGEAAVVSALPSPGGGPPSCAGWPGAPEVLVPSRNSNVLYRVALDAAGGLACGDGCRVPLDPGAADPYAVQVVCRPGAAPLAYVSQLRTATERGALSVVDLAAGTVAPFQFEPSSSPAQSFAYDAAADRLYVTTRFGVLERTPLQTPLRWLELGGSVVRSVNLGALLRGADLRSMAISSDGTRGYLAVRIFDREVATSIGGRPADVAGALAIVDLAAGAGGTPAAALLRLVPVGLGPADVEVLPRGDGRRDVVAVSSSDDGTVTLFDDESGAIAAVLGRDATTGRTLFGRQPFGLVSEPDPAAPGHRRLYVGSFDRGSVSVVDVDLAAPASARKVKQFGAEERP